MGHDTLTKAGIFSATLLTLMLSNTAFAVEPNSSSTESSSTKHSKTVVAPYLREDAPTFNLTVAQFREKFNTTYPHMVLAEYKTIKTLEVKSPLIRAASRINNTLYSSVAIDKSQRTIRSLQLTYLPPPPSEEKQEKPENIAKAEKAARTVLANYIAAFISLFEPTSTLEKCQNKANELLEKGKGSPFYQQKEGTLRFVIADHNEKGITFAIEPIKLSLSDK
ncbi:hypothetical protein SOASR032_27930 [Pragia fontium]|uniref:DUF1454 family protein n=1 Tax=Pragia fontium TaxID=82985 RepID=A0ABQ5LKZ0_9GAMM|nr:YiiQ family protein [Pragia fontium]GKX64224.1 hypothetical protein SOASR032_27930 [Pragia fontium]